MKYFVLNLFLCALLVGGCGEPRGSGAGADNIEIRSDNNPVVVNVIGGEEFPAELAGLWVADSDGWQFMIRPDGKLEYAVISLGRIRVPAGEKTTIEMLEDGVTTVEPGQWVVGFDYNTGDLTVSIDIDDIYSEIGDGTVEGSSRDIFNGPVDIEQGEWLVTWTNFIDYIARTPGQERELTTPDWGQAKQLIFERQAD